MIVSIRSQRFFALFGTIVLLFAGLASTVSAGGETTPADDGWRHTANGWEHISTWNLPPVPSEVELQSSVVPSWCAAWEPSAWLHPVAIAGGLILIGFAGLHLMAEQKSATPGLI